MVKKVSKKKIPPYVKALVNVLRGNHVQLYTWYESQCDRTTNVN